ncbi:MAG: hypothetical protein KGI54_18290 [Pseudomonadota bacterium]|nr:hypothetical protein [Pseudomonadota bacterium]
MKKAIVLFFSFLFLFYGNLSAQAQQVFEKLLSSPPGCLLSGCTFSGPVTVTTLNATGGITSSGIANNAGGVVVQSNATGLNGTNGSLNVNVNYDPSTGSQAGVSYSPTQWNTNISLAANNNAVWQNTNIVLNWTGPGTQNSEVNIFHPVFTCSANCSIGGSVELIETSNSNFGSINTLQNILIKPVNNTTGVITSGLTGINAFYENDNTTAGSIARWVAYNCAVQAGSGTPATYNYCMTNGDPTAAIFSAGPVTLGIQGQYSSASPWTFNIQSMNPSSIEKTLEINDNAGNANLMYFANQVSLSIGFDTFTPNATLYVSDRSGTAASGNHIAFHQAAGIGITNGTLDATASDVSGTITLSAANPVVTFKKAFASVPHCVVSSPTGTAFTYTVSTTILTFTGGANTNKVTYICVQ